MSTSRVGRKPVTIPSGVEVSVLANEIAVKGPKGKAVFPLDPQVSVIVEKGIVRFETNKEGGYCRNGSGQKLRKSIVGTTRSKVAGMIHGVSHAYERKLLLVGVGYKAQAKGKTLGLSLGYSHPVEYALPEGITIETPTPTEIIVKGTDKRLVGEVCAQIRAYRPPELYKGKGVRYSDEQIILKETKKK